MNWPFVTRAMHETTLARADALIAYLKDREAQLSRELAKEQAHSRDLAERALQMRKDGFEPPPPPAPEPETPLPAEVEQAIADRAFDPVTIRRLQLYARQALTTQQPEQVAADILAGESVEEEL